MPKLAYPSWFKAECEDAFALVSKASKDLILNAVRTNDFSLGDKLRAYESSIHIDISSIEFLLTTTIKLINEEDNENVLAEHKPKLQEARNRLLNKRRSGELYQNWVEICEQYQAECAQRSPAKPCVVIEGKP